MKPVSLVHDRLVPSYPLVSPHPLGGLGVFRCRGVGGAALVESGSRVRELVREMSLELVCRGYVPKLVPVSVIPSARSLVHEFSAGV